MKKTSIPLQPSPWRALARAGFAAITLILGLTAARAATINWTGTTGDRNWLDGSNWSGGNVPTNADQVFIDSVNGPILLAGSATTGVLRLASTGDGRMELGGTAYLYSVGVPVLGNNTGMTTTIIVGGSASWETSSHLYVGYSGTAFFTMSDNASILAKGASGFGQQASFSIGSMSGSAVWTATQAFYAGLRGSGSLTIAENARITTPGAFYIAEHPTATFAVEASGSARMEAGTFALIGNNGAASLTLRDSSSLVVGTYMTIGTGTGSGAVVVSDNALLRAGGVLTVGGTGMGSLTLDNGGFVQTGSGVITLAASSGATGVLEITGASAGQITGTNGTSPVTITGGAGDARVVFSHSDVNYVFANNLAGSLSVEHNGSGLTTLTGINTYTGGAIVRGGTLAGTSANLSGSITAEAGGAILFDEPATGVFTGALSGAGALIKAGAGSLALDSTQLAAFTGKFEAHAGTLALNLSALGNGATLSNTLFIDQNAVIALDTGAAALAWNGNFAAGNASAGGTLIKTGAGSLALATPNLAFAGTLAINQGSVTLAHGATLGALAVDAGAMFAGSGTITGNASIDHATLSILPGGGPLVIGGNLAFDNSTLALGSFASGDPIISVNGAVNVTGSNVIDLADGMIGTYTLNGLAPLSGSEITIGGAAQAGTGARQTAIGTALGSDLQIVFTADISRALTWTGSTSANWNAGEENWTGSNNTKLFASLDSVLFDGVTDSANPASRVITLGSGTVRVSDIVVSGGEDYTFGGAGGIASGTTIITEAGNPDNLTGVTGRLVKSGNGTLTFANTGANRFSGGINLVGGALVFNSAAQLGTGGAVITLSGGTLNPAASATLAAPIAISATSKIETPDAITLTLAGSVSGNGALEKTGDGALVFSGENTHTGDVVVSAGTLATRAGNLRGSVVNNGSLVLDADEDDAFPKAISGSGAIVKTGSGALVFSGTATVSTFSLSQGALVINEHTALAATSAFSIAPGAHLVGTGAFSAPSLANAGSIKVGRAANPDAPHGVMTFTGNYTGSGDAEIRLDMSINASGVMEYDRFIINGDATGATLVSLQEQPSAERLRGDTGLLPSLGDMLAVTGSAATGAFVHAGTVEFGGGQYAWDSSANNGAGGWAVLVAEPVSAIGALDAAALLAGKASFASLSNRMLATRETNMPREKQLWVAGLQRREKLSTLRYDTHDTAPRADADTQGIQAGLDWVNRFPEYTFAFGVFADYAKSDMHLPRRASTSTSSVRASGGGLYAMWKTDRWHAHSIVRQARETYDIAAARVAPFSTSGYSWGGLLAIGRDFKPGQRWRVEPEAQLIYQTHAIKDVTDSAGRRYVVDGASSMEGRASVRLAREFPWRDSVKLTPYMRAGWTYDFDGEGRMSVSDELFRNDFGGGGATVDFGLAADLGRGVALHLEGTWFRARSTRGTHINAAFAFAW